MAPDVETILALLGLVAILYVGRWVFPGRK